MHLQHSDFPVSFTPSHRPRQFEGGIISEQKQRLKEGNDRFVRGESTHIDVDSASLRGELAAGQKPFAVILGCSDSRVPVELVFDQGLGDLFVIRIAGNITNPSQIASVEFAVEQFGVDLVVVLGHSNCGAVAATVDALLNDPDKPVGYIVDRIRPGIAPLLCQNLSQQEIIEQGVRANVERSVQTLLTNSAILGDANRDQKLEVVGAEYDLHTGVVTFFDECEGT